MTNASSDIDLMLNEANNSVSEPKYHESFNVLRSMQVTNEMINKIEDGDFIFERLIKSGHIVLCVAESNAGKTTIMTYAAAQMSNNGCRVMYLNMDASSSDLKSYQQHSDRHDYSLIVPDLHRGKSVSDVIKGLQNVADSEADCTGMVLIVDTLKKLTDMINKSSVKEFMMLARRLSVKGMTIVLLGHVNKNPSADGKKLFEGTGDVRSDCDELIYLDSIKNHDGTLTVSTRIDKSRSNAKDITFEISADRVVSVSPSYINVISEKEREADMHLIDFIQNSITETGINLSQLTVLSESLGLGFSRVKIGTVLNKYDSYTTTSKALWTSYKGKKNARNYVPLQEQASPQTEN